MAWEIYSRKAKNVEAERLACEIRLRAERKEWPTRPQTSLACQKAFSRDAPFPVEPSRLFHGQLPAAVKDLGGTGARAEKDRKIRLCVSPEGHYFSDRAYRIGRLDRPVLLFVSPDEGGKNIEMVGPRRTGLRFLVEILLDCLQGRIVIILAPDWSCAHRQPILLFQPDRLEVYPVVFGMSHDELHENALEPVCHVNDIARLRAITPLVVDDAMMFRNPEHRELYLSGLRLAIGEAS